MGHYPQNLSELTLIFEKTTFIEKQICESFKFTVCFRCVGSTVAAEPWSPNMSSSIKEVGLV